MTQFIDLNLNEKILSALEKKGYNTPTPIQQQSIPYVIQGKDLLGIAQTGTGKTAAFSLPILHNLAKNPVAPKSGCMRTLILTPTRELASQIADNIELYGKDLKLRHAVMFGGVSERPQIAQMQRGVDILIATPGRLLDLTNQGYIRFMQLEVFVLDEADRMLDMGFINDIKKIITKLPQTRQTLFFSATMPATIADLANSILTNPMKVEVTPASTTVERIDQKVLHVERSHKAQLLKRLLKDDAVNSVLVFSKTKHGANRVVEFLERNGIKVEAIHGNKSQSAREKALSRFRSGEIKVLVATDIAARGIDIPAISHVINYDIPMDPESYVHRIGRTARAGRDGVAISLCDPSEIKLLREVEKTINYKIPVDETHPFHGVAPAVVSSDMRDPSERRNRREEGNFKRSSQRNDGPRNGERRRRFDSDERHNDRRSNSRRNNSGAKELAPHEKRSAEFTKPSDSKSKKSGFNFFGLGKLFGKKPEDKKFESRGHRHGGRNSKVVSRDDNFGNRIEDSRGNKKPSGKRFSKTGSKFSSGSYRSGSSGRSANIGRSGGSRRPSGNSW